MVIVKYALNTLAILGWVVLLAVILTNGKVIEWTCYYFGSQIY